MTAVQVDDAIHDGDDDGGDEPAAATKVTAARLTIDRNVLFETRHSMLSFMNHSSGSAAVATWRTASVVRAMACAGVALWLWSGIV